MRKILALATLCLLATVSGGSAMSLAVAPAKLPPARTPSCPAPMYAGATELLAALPHASYACAEELAIALRPRAGPAEADALIALAATGHDTRARRNALRVLGRLAESPRGSRARELVLRSHAAILRELLERTLREEHDNFLLQDALWILDSVFYPSQSAAPAMERVAAGHGLAPALRYRAAAARARLIYARPGPLAPDDRDFITGGLRSDDPGVRAAAAMAAARLRGEQLAPEVRDELARALAAAWAAEPPLALAPDDPDARGAARIVFRESSPTSLTARAAIARARDRLESGAAHLGTLRSAYEALALPYTLTRDGITVRSGLPPERLPGLLSEAARVRASLAELLGADLASPLPGEASPHLTVLIFARQGIYRDYVRAFTPFTVEGDGTYDEAMATLYTHGRTTAQSENSLEESLRHELTHHYTAQQLFPGRWLTPGYHAEPKGWLDEGLAEVMAGLGPAGPAPRPAQLARLCARGTPPGLTTLLGQREGYDRYGRFDYDGAWALVAYLHLERPEALRRLAAAYRDGSYRLIDWPRLTGLTLAQAEAEWHRAIAQWCGR